MQTAIDNTQIMVSVEDAEPITLAQFIEINNAEGEDNIVTEEDINDLQTMEVGKFIYVGVCQVKRVA